jgi:hypothetical protein|mmetsp:Transcript_25672/g.40765  ORF Transcript_25672/g.40765 Transcript_25672/m.40765 type:complete len:234 (+) Transcript_25672:140-841(+)
MCGFGMCPMMILLTRLLKFEIRNSEYKCFASCWTLWRQDTGIAMCGPFSAQSADLHTLWKIKRVGNKVQDWGELCPTTVMPIGAGDAFGSAFASSGIMCCSSQTSPLQLRPPYVVGGLGIGGSLPLFRWWPVMLFRCMLGPDGSCSGCLHDSGGQCSPQFQPPPRACSPIDRCGTENHSSRYARKLIHHTYKWSNRSPALAIHLFRAHLVCVSLGPSSVSEQLCAYGCDEFSA